MKVHIKSDFNTTYHVLCDNYWPKSHTRATTFLRGYGEKVFTPGVFAIYLVCKSGQGGLVRVRACVLARLDIFPYLIDFPNVFHIVSTVNFTTTKIKDQMCG